MEQHKIFIEEANTVALFTDEFNTLVKKMFPDHGRLAESLGHGYAHTTHLLETTVTSMKNQLGNPDFVITELTQNWGPELLALAYHVKAAEILHRRCSKAAAEAPAYYY